MNPQKQQLNEYVRKSRAQGYGIGTIRTELLRTGWPAATVDETLRPFVQSATPVPAPAKPKSRAARRSARKSVSQPKAHHQFKLSKLLKLSLIPGLAAVLIILGGFLALRAHHTQTVARRLATSSLQRNANDAQQKNDVNALLAGVNEYSSSNNGQLPTMVATGSTARTLDLCDTHCVSPTKSTVTLNYYHNVPAAVLVHAYAKRLIVPNINTTYIVPAATCISGTLMPAAARNVAMLYESANYGQQCLAN